MVAAAATRGSLREDLARLGVREGDLLMIHAALRTLGPVRGGADTVIAALGDAVGEDGTLVAYVDFEPFYEDEDEDEVPVFDPRIARAARDHGVLHEALRTTPGAVRSAHPDAGVAALGARASWVVEPHPLQYGYGEGTPFERVIEAGGRVLMLGAPLDTITLLHYAEHRARIGGKRIRRYRRHLATPDGPRWVAIEEFDTAMPVHDALPENCFEQIAEAYLASGRGLTGTVGAGPAWLFEAPELVGFGIGWIERYLH